MCQASRAAARWEDAEQDATYSISVVGIHGRAGRFVGALHASGSTIEACVYCIKHGQKITLLNIPEELRQRFALGETAKATFCESKAHHKDDVLNFGRNKRIGLRAFADKGISLYVGEKSGADLVVASIIADASKAADENGRIEAGQRELVDA